MLEKQKDSIFYRKCNPKSLLTATTLAGWSTKHWVFAGTFLKMMKSHRNSSKKLYKQHTKRQHHLAKYFSKIFDEDDIK